MLISTCWTEIFYIYFIYKYIIPAFVLFLFAQHVFFGVLTSSMKLCKLYMYACFYSEQENMNFVEDHPMYILTKFTFNWCTNFGENQVYKLLTTTLMTDDYTS